MSRANEKASTAPQSRRNKLNLAALIAKVLRIGVAIGLLYYVASKVSFAELLEIAAGANKGNLGFAFAMFVFVQALASVRLKKLLAAQTIHLPVMRVFEVNLSARFYGLALPGGNLATSLVRVLKLTREGAIVSSVVTALFADRILATLSMCLIGLLFWWSAPAHVLWLLAFAAASTACAILVVALFIRSIPLLPPFVRGFITRLAPSTLDKISATIHRSRFSGQQLLIESLALSFSMNLVGTVAYWLIARSLDIPLNLIDIAWIRAAMMLAALLPITSSGLGVRELATLSLLSSYDIEPGLAIAFSLLVFATMVVGIGLAGAVVEALRIVRR